LEQTYSDFEIIIVNDGSTDNSYEVAKSIKSDRITLLSQKNKGVSVARNLGAERAKYEYLLFLDADDGLFPAYLEEMASLIGEFPEAGIYSSNLKYYKSKINRFFNRDISFLDEKNYIDNYFKTVLTRGHLITSIVVYKKEVFQNSGGFVEGMIRGQDTYLLCKILLTEKLAFLNKPLYFVTYDADNRATDLYRPSNTDESLMDYFGSGVPYADIYIFKYVITQIHKMIMSGYKNEALDLFNKLKKCTPESLFYLVDLEKRLIDKKIRVPAFYYRKKQQTIKKLVALKDFIKFRLLKGD